MHLHDYIIISQNKQDNSRICTILDYHLVCSDHDERVTKVGPAIRIIELEAKSKCKCRAASFFILRRVWRLSITYYLLVMFERACPQIQCKHKTTHCTSNLTFFAILLHPYPCWGRVLDITPKVCCRHCCKALPHFTINTTSSKKLTPQADQEPEHYWSGHDWYSKLISLEHEHRLLKF